MTLRVSTWPKPKPASFVERGETIALPADVFGGCVRVELEPGTEEVQHLRIVGASTAKEREACARVVSGLEWGR